MQIIFFEYLLIYLFSTFPSFMRKIWTLHTAWKVSVFGVILVRIFPHSDRIRTDTEYLSVFRPNVGKSGPEYFWTRILFNAVTNNGIPLIIWNWKAARLACICSKQQWKHQSNMWNMYKVINKETKSTSMALFRCLYC